MSPDGKIVTCYGEGEWMAAERQRIFVSYSHSDVQWLQRLTLVLAPLVRDDRIDLWDDRRIQPGAQWRGMIDEALDAADVAVLLVSASFLASPFIRQFELPSILERWKAGQLAVVWVAVSPTLYEVTPLKGIRAANDPGRPLSELNDSAIDTELVRIAQLITSGSAVTAVGRALRTVDNITYQLADVAGVGERQGPPSVVAAPTNGTVELHRRVSADQPAEVVETITPEDLGLLTDRQRQLIETFEASMYVEFDRWNDLYRRKTTLTINERQVLKSSAQQMCFDLTHIIDFLSGIGKNLIDHYVEVRFICNNVANM
jgi:TIR domain